MKFVILTLFPGIFDGFTRSSLIGKAVENGIISFDIVNIRDYALDKHRTVDDAPYGGGPGMVMQGEPLLAAMDDKAEGTKILLSPQGSVFGQKDAVRLASCEAITLLCGRYEGIDERVRDSFDEEISIGDFVLAGGEVAAMAVTEATARMIPGVMGNSQSLAEESISCGLLEYPQYTRPEVLRGQTVPSVLLSGNHEEIRKWRRIESLKRTLKRRPDLLENIELTKEERGMLDEDEA